MRSRSFGLVISLLLYTQSVAAQDGPDATFNGLATRINCVIGSLLTCENNFCSAGYFMPNQPFARFEINLQEKTYDDSGSSGRGMPMASLEVSPAQMNKPIFVKWVTGDKTPVNITLFGTPQQGGRYRFTLAGMQPQENGKSAIIAGSCDQVY